MDNLLEFGSNVDIDFIAICDFETKNKAYKKNDIVLSLRDVYATLYYHARTTNNVSRYTELYYSDYSLGGMTLSGVPLNKYFYDLFSAEKLNNIVIRKKEKDIALGKTVYIVDTNVVVDSAMVEGMEPSTYEVHYQEGGAYITSQSFVDGQEYVVQFDSIYNGHSFNMYSADAEVPYLKMQIKFLGNEDKDTAEGYLIIDKASLVYQPNVNFTKEHVASCDLRCVVVDAKECPPKLVVIDGE